MNNPSVNREKIANKEKQMNNPNVNREKIAKTLLVMAKELEANDTPEVREKQATKLVRMAKGLVGEFGTDWETARPDTFEAEVDEVEDVGFRAQVQELRQMMPKLVPRQRRKLSQFGIPMLRPSMNTVEDLVNALRQVVMS